MIQIVGLSTLFDKPRGPAGIIYFADADRWTSERAPTRDEMRKYATSRGYSLPDGAVCDPVYVYIDREGH